MHALPLSPRRARGRHRRPSLPRRAAVLTTTGVVVLGGAGAGYAAWTVTASGSSGASSGAPQAGVVSAATPATRLFPGGATPLSFTVTNPNPFPVTYTSVGFGAVSVDDATACPPATHLTTQNQTVSITLAAGATSSVQTPAGAITMRSTAPDGCQNRTITVATTVSGQSG